jgi:hypothetical protein
MKQYLLFVGDDYHPCGGWEDFHSCYESVQEAKLVGVKALKGYSWWHIVDLTTYKVVARGR